MLDDLYNWFLTQLKTDGGIYRILNSQYFLYGVIILLSYMTLRIILRPLKTTILCLLDNESGKVFIKNPC
jgi:hypothetical protein